MNSFCLALKEGIVYMDLRAEAEVCIGASIIFVIWFVHQQIFNMARVYAQLWWKQRIKYKGLLIFTLLV